MQPWKGIGFSEAVGAFGLGISLINAGYSISQKQREQRRSKFDNETRLMARFLETHPNIQYFEQLQHDNPARRWGYVKAFKDMPPETYSKADLHRQQLSHFWREVCNQHQAGEVPDGFLAPGSDWHMKARRYIELMEPIDIANYCRLGFHNTPSGPYNNAPPGQQPNRPSQYTYLEQATKMPNFMDANYDSIWRDLSS